MKVASFNVDNGFYDPKRAKKLARGIEKIDADIVVLPEGFDEDEGKPKLPRSLREKYDVQYFPYDQANPMGGREGKGRRRHGFIVLSRVATSVAVINYDSPQRNQLVIDAFGDDIRHIGGVHFDDRWAGKRMSDAQTYLEQAHPEVILGTLNALSHETSRESLLGSRAIGGVVGALPTARMRSVAGRVREMATPEDETLAMLRKAGYLDADLLQKPTMKPAIGAPAAAAALKLDYIMYDPSFVTVEDHTVHRGGGSDHLAISGDVVSS
jgi:endonuclease/exonuclease/phosphatase family metal-dependent hydrolase